MDHIRDRRYPITAEVVAVTAGPVSEPSRALLDWLTGLTGYVPLESQPELDVASL